MADNVAAADDNDDDDVAAAAAAAGEFDGDDCTEEVTETAR